MLTDDEITPEHRAYARRIARRLNPPPKSATLAMMELLKEMYLPQVLEQMERHDALFNMLSRKC